jgi:uncharacterized peroxidase-related enzyme
MPRIPYAEKGQQAEGATATYEQIEKSFGMVPNVVKLLGHSGAATQGMGELLRVYFGELSLSPRIREVAYVTVAKHNGCAYCQGHHVPMLQNAGMGDDQIEVLGEAGFNSERLSAEERAVVRFAWETSHHVKASDAAFEELQKHYDTAQIAELTFVVAMANFVQRVGRNLEVELEF